MKRAYLLQKLNLSLLDDAKPYELIILPRRFVINKLKERLVEKTVFFLILIYLHLMI